MMTAEIDAASAAELVAGRVTPKMLAFTRNYLTEKMAEAQGTLIAPMSGVMAEHLQDVLDALTAHIAELERQVAHEVEQKSKLLLAREPTLNDLVYEGESLVERLKVVEADLAVARKPPEDGEVAEMIAELREPLSTETDRRTIALLTRQSAALAEAERMIANQTAVMADAKEEIEVLSVELHHLRTTGALADLHQSCIAEREGRLAAETERGNLRRDLVQCADQRLSAKTQLETARRALSAGREKLATYASVYAGDKELRNLLVQWDAVLQQDTAP